MLYREYSIDGEAVYDFMSENGSVMVGPVLKSEVCLELGTIDLTEGLLNDYANKLISESNALLCQSLEADICLDDAARLNAWSKIMAGAVFV